MLKIVIVDDEPFALEKMKNAINWNKYGFILVATFQNPIMCLEYLEKNSVDVLLTDIKMSEMSGIEMAKQGKEIQPNLFVVLISAFQEFEYAKQALHYGFFDYLSKPLQYEDIITLLEKIKVASTGISPSSQFAMHEAVCSFQQIISNIIGGVISDNELLCNYLATLDITAPIFNIPCKVINMTYDLSEIGNGDMSLNQIDNIITNFLPYNTKNSLNCSFRITRSSVEILTIKKNGDFEENTQNLITELTKTLAEYLKYTFSYSVLSFTSIQDFLNTYTLHTHSKEKSGIERTLKYIHENYSEKLSIAAMADYVHFNPTYFCSYFKKYTGMTFVEYVNRYRIIQAKNMIETTDKTMTAICEDVGFKNPTYFFMLFKKYVGEAPSQYKKHFDKNGVK